MRSNRTRTLLAIAPMLVGPAWAGPVAASITASPFVLLAMYLAGLFLLTFECITPGFGVIGFSGLGLLGLQGMIIWDVYGPALAQSIFVVEILVGGAAIYGGFKALPHTAVGRGLIQSATVDAKAAGLEALDPDLWTGKTGTAVGALRPAGTVRIDDRDIPAKSRQGWIDGGTAIRVVGTEGENVLVEKA